jgi:hypothetical protein
MGFALFMGFIAAGAAFWATPCLLPLAAFVGNYSR